MCFSPIGEDIIIYDENRTISCITKNKLSWNYNIKDEIIDMRISLVGDYFVILDNNFKLSLFSKNVDVEKMSPLWSHYISSCKIRDIYSSGSIPPLVYVLVSNGSNLFLFTREGTLIWSYKLLSEESTSKISWDGSWIVTIDSKGLLSTFSIKETNPSWTLKTEIINASLEISLDNRFLLVSGENEGNNKGLIYLLSLKTGEIKFKKEFNSPIKEACISYNGNKIFILCEDGSVIIFYKENENMMEIKLNFDQKLESIIVPPYSPYFLGLSYDGELFLFHLSRRAPLWKYPMKCRNTTISTSLNGEKIFVAESNNINILLNSLLSEIIPGSRTLWGVIFSIGILIILNLLYFLMKKHKIIIVEKCGIFIASICFSIGTFFGFLQLKSLINSLIFCGLPFSTTFTLSFKKKNLASFLISSYIGYIFCGITGIIFGLSKWLYGDERDIIQLTIYYGIYGLNTGFPYVIFGTVIGFLITLSYNRLVKI